MGGSKGKFQNARKRAGSKRNVGQKVKDWAKKYNKDLMEMWKTQKYRQPPGLE